MRLLSRHEPGLRLRITPLTMAHSECWHTGSGCVGEDSPPPHGSLHKLLERPYNMATRFPRVTVQTGKADVALPFMACPPLEVMYHHFLFFLFVRSES